MEYSYQDVVLHVQVHVNRQKFLNFRGYYYLRELHNSLSSYPQKDIALKTVFDFSKMIIRLGSANKFAGIS
jgi:hypothetical protein